jgi:toxin secretion/phage lysis holin
MENFWKAIIAGITAALMAYFKQLVVPVTVLIAVMICDYITGMTAAWMNKELSSRKGIQGVIKKIFYLMIVAVGMGIDYLIVMLSGKLGVQLGINFVVGLLVIVWLIINELISILENSGKIGVPMPAFLMKLLDRLKQTAEKKAELEEAPPDN